MVRVLRQPEWSLVNLDCTENLKLGLFSLSMHAIYSQLHTYTNINIQIYIQLPRRESRNQDLHVVHVITTIHTVCLLGLLGYWAPFEYLNIETLFWHDGISYLYLGEV